MPNIRAVSFYGGRGSALPRKLRRQQTDAEAVLWRHLRRHHLAGAKFRRQQPIGPYIVDLYCHEHGLVVEVDGGQHYESSQAARDNARSEWLQAAGLRVIRFSNLEVLKETDAVLERILVELRAESPHPDPLPEGEGTGTSRSAPQSV